MPIRVELRDYTGAVVDVTGEQSDEIDATLPVVDFDDYPLMAGVDRYGETVFNTMQMEILAQEIDRMRTSTQPVRRERLLEAISKMCRIGAKRTHSKLVFIGD